VPVTSAPEPASASPPVPPSSRRRDESVTTRLEVSPELIASMLLDDSERPTVRMPIRPPFVSPEDEELAREQKTTDVTVQRRFIVGPDGLPQMIDDDDLEETTRVGPPPKVLVSRTKIKGPKRKSKR